MSSLQFAVVAAQALLQSVDNSLLTDGKPGSYTKGVYDKAGPALRDQIARVFTALGAGTIDDAFTSYQVQKKKLAASPAASVTVEVWKAQVIPALVREAMKSGVDPAFLIAQNALESGWGAHTPLSSAKVNKDEPEPAQRLPVGVPSYNYAGLKWNTVKPAQFCDSWSPEVDPRTGKSYQSIERFAAFATPAEFARAYVQYLGTYRRRNGALRYPGVLQAKTIRDYATILKAGGYAASTTYVADMERTANGPTVRRLIGAA